MNGSHGMTLSAVTRKTAARATRGVTLIELLVVITLLGLVSLGLLFSMRVGVSAWQRANARMSADRAVVAASDLLAAQLGGARARTIGWGQREQRISFVYFEGRADRLRFLTDYSVASRTRGGTWLAEYWFQSNAAKECRLLYNETNVRSEDDVAPTIEQAGFNTNGLYVNFRGAVAGPSTRILYNNLRDCSFQYLIEPPNLPVYWGEAWPGDPRLLPHAVAVRFSGTEGRGIAPVATVAMLNTREVFP